ncbi:eukaryotic translation initiation factor 4E-like [Onthophagus taurus]|uniref:eukaryotic translation initiation factor 4E-like n=1 Tax=Onthophagus taurus TaxID=166361 RepID=UPI000C20DDDE|nr:eukaryotic translation initiation factor 4E-like [Onthophagus taurus]
MGDEKKENAEKQKSVLNPEAPAFVMRTKPIKHTLPYTWTFWYYKRVPGINYRDNLHQVVSFDTLEDFWLLYHHLSLVSDLRNMDYLIFKLGVTPVWEDVNNQRGGRWEVHIPSALRNEVLTTVWVQSVLYSITDWSHFSQQLCGVVATVRYRYDRIGIWTSDANDRYITNAIAEEYQNILDANNCGILQYQPHKVLSRRARKSARNK